MMVLLCYLCDMLQSTGPPGNGLNHTHLCCRWKGLKKRMLNRREQLASLQQAEAVEIRRKSDAVGEKVEDYRKWVARLPRALALAPCPESVVSTHALSLAQAQAWP